MESSNVSSGDESHSTWFSYNFRGEWNEFSKKPYLVVRANYSNRDLQLIGSWCYWFASSRGWSHRDCEDLAQSVLLRFLDREVFLYTMGYFCWIGVRDCGSELRAQIKRCLICSPNDLLGLDLADIYSEKARSAIEIHEWIRLNFSSRNASIVIADFFDNISQFEIAERFEVSLSTVSRVSRQAKEMFRRSYFNELAD